MFPWAHPIPHPKQHVDWFSRFCRAHDCERQTDRQTTLYSETTGRIYVVLRRGVMSDCFADAVFKVVEDLTSIVLFLYSP